MPRGVYMPREGGGRILVAYLPQTGHEDVNVDIGSLSAAVRTVAMQAHHAHLRVEGDQVTASHGTPTSARHVPVMCQSCARHVPVMCQACARHVPVMRQACARHVPGMCQACARHVPGMCQAARVVQVRGINQLWERARWKDLEGVSETQRTPPVQRAYLAHLGHGRRRPLALGASPRSGAAATPRLLASDRVDDALLGESHNDLASDIEGGRAQSRQAHGARLSATFLRGRRMRAGDDLERCERPFHLYRRRPVGSRWGREQMESR